MRLDTLMEGLTYPPEQESEPAAPAGAAAPRRPASEDLARRFRDIIDGFGPSALIAVLSVDGKVIETNRSALQAAGLTPAEVIGRRFDELAPWTHSAAVGQRLRLPAAWEGPPGSFIPSMRICPLTIVVDPGFAVNRGDPGAPDLPQNPDPPR